MHNRAGWGELGTFNAENGYILFEEVSDNEQCSPLNLIHHSIAKNCDEIMWLRPEHHGFCDGHSSVERDREERIYMKLASVTHSMERRRRQTKPCLLKICEYFVNILVAYWFAVFVLGRSEKVDSETEAYRHPDKGGPVAFYLCQQFKIGI